MVDDVHGKVKWKTNITQTNNGLARQQQILKQERFLPVDLFLLVANGTHRILI
jgi:hypothetical protein